MSTMPRVLSTNRSLFPIGIIVAVMLQLGACRADDEPKARSPEEIAQASRRSVVVINSSNRQGDMRGIGSGFIVRPDGVIATNYHVIGEGRPFVVQLADGKSYEPTAVLAVDRAQDLALVQIDAKELPALELGNSDDLRPGQPVLAVGNPLGLRLSVTDGVVAEKRELGGHKMIQLAMPIEPGNSGGPVIDRQGRVVGVIAIKSVGSIAFAVPANELKPLLDKPHPVTMSRWLKIGAMDSNEWTTQMGGQWRQRAGRIVASGLGDGFGGRTLCLAQSPPPNGPFEIAVQVKLHDETGAAGLVFHSDGGHKHYGFYPTNGSLRLTRFEGPDVNSWTILETVPSEHYRPGDWNTIKVRVDGAKLRCSVNDGLVIEAEDAKLTGGKIGLVKFREPAAEFRHFRVAAELPADKAPDDLAGRVADAAAKLPASGPPDPTVLTDLMAHGPAGRRVLRDLAGDLEKQAARLRRVADLVHQRGVVSELQQMLGAKEEAIDLVQSALMLAKLDNEELELEPYRKLIDRMAAEIREQLGEQATDAQKIEALNKYMFQEWGFHGSRVEYYHRSNSYLNEVLDDREGIPITLSIVFIELARRIGLPIAGLATPGHFLVQHKPQKGDPQLIDPFDGGKPLTRAEAEAVCGRPLTDRDLAGTTKRAIIVRMLHNLLNVAQREQDLPGVTRYLDVIVALDENSGPDRWMRAVLRFQSGQPAGAAEDLDWIIDHEPAGMNLDEVRQLRELVRRQGG